MLLATIDLFARGGGGGRFLFPLLLLGLLVWLTLVLLRRRGVGFAGATGAGSPMQTLQDRFARGEIDQREFDHRRAVLRGKRDVPPAAPAGGTDADGPDDAE
ncbi:MAG: SHOCT domain-containing protein [Actinomycetota bacterium]